MAMSTLNGSCAAGSDPSSVKRQATRGASPAVFRSILLIGCVACTLMAAGLGEPASFVRADPQLALLLRSMSLIKGTIVLAAVAVLWWRFGHPVLAETAVAYISGAAVLAGASTLIWQLSFIPLAALAFHVAAFVILVAAWRDGGTKVKLRHRAG